MNVYICKIPLENLPGESVSVYTTWTNDSFLINIFHKDKAWNKSVSEVDLKSLCGFSQNSVAEYLLETKRALTCDGGCAEFTYSLIKSEFIWKKLIDDSIKVKFGSLILEEIPVSLFTEKAVDFLLNRCITLTAKNNSLMKENYDLRAANTSLRTHVCSITKLKTEMEETLYNKSLAVLNAKKEKISGLQRIIEANATSDITLDAGHEADGVETGFAPNKLSELSGSETELDTDECSDVESPLQSSTLGTSSMSRNKNELLPIASKLQKLEDTSSSTTSECLVKGKTGNQDDDDDANIFIPVRRKKNKIWSTSLAN